MSKMFFLTLAICFTFLFPVNSFAGEVDELKKEVQLLKQMLQSEAKKRQALEEKVNAVEGRSIRVEQAQQEAEKKGSHFNLSDPENPLSLGGGVTGIIQGSSGNKNSIDGTNDRTALSLTVDLGLNARLSEHHRLYIDMEAGIGDGGNDRVGGVGATSTVNYDPYNTTGATTNLALSTIYWSGEFLDQRLVVSAGKMDPNGFWDENNYANDETSQFVTGMFVRGAGTLHPEAQNYYAPSLAVQYAVNDYIDLAWVANSSDFNDIFVNIENVAQLTLKPQLIEGLEGNYRFFYMNDGRVYNDIVSGQRKNGNSGGVSFDQQITDNIALFGRYELIDKNVSFSGGNNVESFWSGGVDLAGALWGRPRDNIGIAYGSLSYNKRLVKQKNEDHFEAYYNAAIFDRLHISPHYQYIHNIKGVAAYRSVSVFGFRSQFDF